jgi:hypothetical protein
MILSTSSTTSGCTTSGRTKRYMYIPFALRCDSLFYAHRYALWWAAK